MICPIERKMKRIIYAKILLAVLSMVLLLPADLLSQGLGKRTDLDQKVMTFLEKRQGSWQGSECSGVRRKNPVRSDHQKQVSEGARNRDLYRSLHDLIAWALSKTGGKVITIEIDEKRYRQALANFREAGLSEYIDARLADAHQLVKELPGPFDFVFCDADKEWYKRYFIDLYPKLEAGGCYTAHNVSARSWGMGEGTKEFLDYVKSLRSMKTTVDESGGGLSISYKQ